MKALFQTIFCLCVLVIGAHLLGSHYQNTRRGELAAAVEATKAARFAPDDQGFIPLPMPAGAPSNRVVIFLPSEGSKAAEQRTRELEKALVLARVMYTRMPKADIKSADEDEAAKVKEVIEGDLPVVFINGRVKNNPTADEVVAEFKVAGKTPAKVATKR